MVIIALIVLIIHSVISFYRIHQFSNFLYNKIDECYSLQKYEEVPDISASYRNFDQTLFWDFDFEKCLQCGGDD